MGVDRATACLRFRNDGMFVTTMACLHGVFVGEWLFVFPLCGFSLSLFRNYYCMCMP